MTNRDKGKPIPNDWDGESYVTFLLCCPDSTTWRSYVRGAVYDLTRGRKWDGSTGSILDVQSIAWEVYDSMGTCDDLAVQLSALVTAVNSIAINIVTQGSGGDGCCGSVSGGEFYPSSPGEEGGVPPENFEVLSDLPGTQPYQARKCKIANLMHSQIRDLLERVLNSDVLSWGEVVIGQANGVLLSTIIGYIIGELATPFPILDGLVGSVIGWVAGLVIKLLVGDVDLPALIQSLDDNEANLVCALYNANSVAQASNDYLQVLADDGVNIANREIILALMVPNLLNALFYGSVLGQGLEEQLEGYTGNVNCTQACGCVSVTYDFDGGLQNWSGELTHDGTNGLGGTGCLKGTLNSPLMTVQQLKQNISIEQFALDAGILVDDIDFNGDVTITLSYKPSIAAEVGGAVWVEYEDQSENFVDLWDGIGIGNDVYHGPYSAVIPLIKNGFNATMFKVGIGTGGTNNIDRDGFVDNVTVELNC